MGIAILLALFLPACQSSKYLKGLEDGLYAQMITDKGDILLFLEHEKVPNTVASFVGLAEGEIENKAKEKGVPFFDGLTFHRCIDNFMIQGGDPAGNGTGNPGYRFKDEFDESLEHDRPGILSMANSGPNTNGSQFFITHGPTPHLNGRHAVFGHVVKGMEAVNAMKNGDKIKQVKIYRKGSSARKFDAAATFKPLK